MVIKLLATDLEPHKLPVGTGVVGEGEVGEPLYLIVAGSAAVSVQETRSGLARPPGHWVGGYQRTARAGLGPLQSSHERALPLIIDSCTDD